MTPYDTQRALTAAVERAEEFASRDALRLAAALAALWPKAGACDFLILGAAFADHLRSLPAAQAGPLRSVIDALDAAAIALDARIQRDAAGAADQALAELRAFAREGVMP